jgi:AcrR family transcriptional regulator
MPRFTPSARRELTEKRRKQILDAALKVFAAKGFDRATIADVAREAKIAEGSIYNYFKSKGDLLIGIPRQVIQAPFESLGTIALAGSPEEKLASVARVVLAEIRQNSHVFRILISALPNMSKKLRQQYLQQVILYATGMLQARFQELIDRGVFRKELNSTILARAFVGMFFPTIIIQEVLQLDVADPVDYDEMVTTCVEVFLHGAMIEPPSEPTRLHHKIPIE